MKEGLKCAAVFIGAVIGAGFATGREIALFFRGCSPLTAMLSGVFLSAFGCMFMKIGNRFKDDNFGVFLFRKHSGIFKLIMLLCSFITFIVMFSGAESIFMQLYDVGYVGALCAFGAVCAALCGLKNIKLINLAAVPCIVAAIVFVFIKSPKNYGGGFSVVRPLSYAALNLTIGGCVMMKLGKTASDKEIKWCFKICAVVFSLTLFMLSSVVANSLDEMPFLSAARSVGAEGASAALIAAAIFTTLLSSADLLIAGAENAVGGKTVAGGLLLSSAWLVCTAFSFSTLVDTLYPLVGACGVILLFLTFFRFAEEKISLKRRGYFPDPSGQADGCRCHTDRCRCHTDRKRRI